MHLVPLAKAIHAKQISPVEVIDWTIRQIETHNPALNAFVLNYFEEARQRAREIESNIMKGNGNLEGEVGLLAGIPLTIKDSLNIAGSVTACGSRVYANNKAATDATSVCRLREAGGIIIGKTNCPEFLMNYETDNHLIGTTNNPWDLSRTAGGSSGGESAAIASFCSFGGIGSDGGGSIRVPAHFCGIAGLKPTPGRVSAAGHLPEIAHPGGLLGVAGPMARTAEDVRLLFKVLAHHDPADPFSVPIDQRQPDLVPFQQGSLRIGVMKQWLNIPVEPEIEKAVQNAADMLSQLKFTVEEFQPCSMERATKLWWFFFVQIHSRVTSEYLKEKKADLHWTGVELLDQALSEPEPTVKAVLENLAIRDKMRASLLQQMATHRVLLLPACGVAAFPHRQRRWQTPTREIGLQEAMAPLTPFNLFGMPGMVIPFGMSEEGIPIGIQLVGHPYDEELLLEIAVLLERARGPFPAPARYTPLVQ